MELRDQCDRLPHLPVNGTQSVLVGNVTATTNSFMVGNFAQGTSYTFSVQAYNATNAASSALVTGTTMAMGITAPGNLRTRCSAAPPFN